jgi:hypothetical protein
LESIFRERRKSIALRMRRTPGGSGKNFLFFTVPENTFQSNPLQAV